MTSTTDTAAIAIGRTSGKWFSQDKLDACLQLAKKLQAVGAINMQVWYDNHEDYHRIDGVMNDRQFTVHYYKVFRLSCNGYKTTGPMHDCWWVPQRLREWSTSSRGNEIYGQPPEVNPERIGISPAVWNVE